MTHRQAYRYLFGPVPSRRLGLSLGVDLNPVKVCTENCVFCQIGQTTELTLARREWVPTADVIAAFERWRAGGAAADFITLAGSGEPTLHTGFGDVLRHVRGAGKYKTALLSNGSLMWLPEVRRDAAAADVVKVTISAWDEASFQRIHRPAAGLTFEKLMAGARALRNEFAGQLWVEVMLLRGYNDLPEQVRAIAELVRGVRPDAVHLNTVMRPAQAGVPVARVSEARLREVAGFFEPAGEVPEFHGEGQARGTRSDDEWVAWLARHPMELGALAQAEGMSVAELERRLGPLVAAGKVVVGEREGVRMVRVRSVDG